MHLSLTANLMMLSCKYGRLRYHIRTLLIACPGPPRTLGKGGGRGEGQSKCKKWAHSIDRSCEGSWETSCEMCSGDF